MIVRRLVLLVPLLLAPACAGGDDDDDGAASFGGQSGASQPTMPTMPTMPASASASESASEGDETSYDPTSSPAADPSNDPGDPAAVCGNNVLEDDEACDGENLADKDCLFFGFEMGSLACGVDCQFDTSLCANPGCGDGVLMGGEDCDCGEQAGACTPAGLNMYECTDLVSPKGTHYNGGALTCNSPAACNFDEAGCTYCGDNTVSAPEACDGQNLGGQTCVSLGFKAGNAFCNPDCTVNTTGCTNVVCGDNECGAGEDSCSCPEDCPDNDPEMCSPCECGGFTGLCGCGIDCFFFGDCCINGPC